MNAAVETPAGEVEIKLATSPKVLAKIQRRKAVTAATEGRPKTRTLVSVYYDTPDWRLWRRGLTLRVRKDGRRFTQTLKSEDPDDTVAGLKERQEWECPRPGLAPDVAAFDDAEARERCGLILPAELSPVFTITVNRQIRLLRTEDAQGAPALVEAAFDDGAIEVGGVTHPLCELELELKEGTPSALFALARTLSKGEAMAIESRSKPARAFAHVNNEPPPWNKGSKPALNASLTVEDTLVRIFRTCLAHWSSNEAAALDGRDPEGVHQMRVGLRRFRSALSMFKSALAPEAREWLAAESKWAANSLGRARDWDVFLDELVGPLLRDWPDDPRLQAVRTAAEACRRAAYEAAREAVGSARYTAFMLRLAEWLTAGTLPLNPEGFEHDLTATADRLLERRWKRLRKTGRHFEHLPEESRHEVRIVLKRLRYAVEFFGPLYPDKKAKPFIRAAQALQDDLGHANDVATARTLLAELIEAEDGGVDRVALIGGAGLVLGWHLRGLADAESELVADWTALANSKRFWHRPNAG